MKTDKQIKRKNAKSGGLQSTQMNSGKKFGGLAVLAAATAVGIISVWNIGQKAQQTVEVCMIDDGGAYKNQLITDSMIKPYEMLQAEYEKYAYKESNGVTTERIILYEDKDKIAGKAYAAFPLSGETVMLYEQLIKSRVDNSDTVLFSFPGKDIVQLDIGKQDLNAFKTFLQPGDKLNIEATYSEEIEIPVDDEYGNITTERVDQYKTETVFGNIMIADLINSKGESILDIYSDYNSKSIFAQDALDNSSSFQDSVTPSSLLVALTPKEKEIYYKYLAKDNVTFRVSLPQRTK